ncbi:hypothetical protein [Anaerobacillus sp. CMMVII]|uniref:hypothetical protein n=1 Tax=Anaerobacillus sp. CMMVII TaxID=2755588 RepID=UPI0021B70417|nr:hypothetical protein [Anaerobacillus sp. CMMVII]
MMKAKTLKHIIEDLLPLYEEGLLSEETTAWLEEQARTNDEYAKLLQLSAQSLPKGEIESPVDSKKCFNKLTESCLCIKLFL